MPFPEDSGIESEDKPSLSLQEDDSDHLTTLHLQPSTHDVDFEVDFRSPGFNTTRGDNECFTSGQEGNNKVAATSTPNSCRIFQRKLELKVEKAKRLYCQQQQQLQLNKQQISQASALIPHNRLSIPGDLDQKLLVDYQSESENDEYCDGMFFQSSGTLHSASSRLQQAQGCGRKRTELTDTFSLQEMTIESDAESIDSTINLELLTPRLKRHSILEYLSNCFCCWKYE